MATSGPSTSGENDQITDFVASTENRPADPDEDLMEMFDPEQFVLDGNDIRFQLPSHNTEIGQLTLSSKMEDVQRKATSIKRRRTGKSVVLRRKSTKAPPVDRSTKPRMSFLTRRKSATYDFVDGGDNADNEEPLLSSVDQYMELQNLRSLTLPMKRKKIYREQLRQCQCVDPVGVSLAQYTLTKIFSLNERKAQQSLSSKWGAMVRKMNEVSVYADIWQGTLKEIEGQFGSGIMEYFKLVKWMIFLNLLLSFTMLPIILPQELMYPKVYKDKYQDVDATLMQADLNFNIKVDSLTTNINISSEASPLVQLSYVRHEDAKALSCTMRYNDTMMLNITRGWHEYLLDFFQGTGIFENTLLFYGYYFNKTHNIGPQMRTVDTAYPLYNTSVSYLLSIMVFFIISLLFIVTSTSSGLEQNVLSDQNILYKSINQIFASWDYALYKEKAVRVKKALIRQEIMRDMAEIRRKKKYHERTTTKRCLLYMIRIVVNLIVIVILAGCAAAVYFAQLEAEKQLKIYQGDAQTQMNPVASLFWQYLSSVLITVMYAIFPIVFSKLATLEKYYPATEQNITIARIVLLRLGTVILLLLPVYVRVIQCGKMSELQNNCGSCDDLLCWETFIGQQLYKLVLLDFFVIVGVVFLVEFPRKFLVKKFPHVKVFSYIGQEEFDISVNVMDVVYSQTLCWIGAFYSPLIPLITFVKVFLFFFLRKLSLFHNQKPPTRFYRSSSMNLFFKCVLTVSFFFCIMAVGISVGIISPSRSCGPFRSHSNFTKPGYSYTMFDSVTEAMLLLPPTVNNVVVFITSAPFVSALIVVLLILIYVYAARTSGQNRLIELLRETLKREEKDKHWLLTKVNVTLRKKLSTKAL